MSEVPFDPTEQSVPAGLPASEIEQPVSSKPGIPQNTPETNWTSQQSVEGNALPGLGAPPEEKVVPAGIPQTNETPPAIASEPIPAPTGTPAVETPPPAPVQPEPHAAETPAVDSSSEGASSSPASGPTPEPEVTTPIAVQPEPEIVPPPPVVESTPKPTVVASPEPFPTPTPEVDQQRIKELMNNDPEFAHNPALLEELKPLFDTSADPQAQQNARQKLEQVYQKYQTDQQPPPPVTPPRRETRSTNPADAQEAKKRENLRKKADAYKNYLGAEKAQKPDKAKLFAQVESNSPEDRAHAEKFLDEELGKYVKHEVDVFTSNGYYEMLGVPKTANADQLKTAYRRLAKEYHPDLTEDDPVLQEKNKQIFQAISEAYRVLNDDNLRGQYDLGITQPQRVRTQEAPRSGWASPLEQVMRDVFTGEGFSMGGFGTGFDFWGPATPGFGAADFGASPFTREPSPEQKARAEKRQREADIKNLETDVRTAKNILTLLDALEKAKKVNHVFTYPDRSNYQSGVGYATKQFEPQVVIDQIKLAAKKMRADESEFKAAIDALPEHLDIQRRVKNELINRREALDTLQEPNADHYTIKASLQTLANQFDNISVKINGQTTVINAKEQFNILNKITSSSHKPAEVNTLIGQLTAWNDADLKVYYSIRESSYNSAWKKLPIPPSIAARYEQYKQNRESPK